MGVEVVTVGEYTSGRLDSRVELTQRQFEAVEAAADTGYYNTMREATPEEIADRLGCSSGTAGELPRWAERTAMAMLVTRGPV
jgi:predicted DNA binding protein